MNLIKEEKNGIFFYKAVKGDDVLEVGRIENLSSQDWKELEKRLIHFGGEELLEIVRAEIKKHPYIENIDIEPSTVTDDVAL